jgi:hypothetical protein
MTFEEASILPKSEKITLVTIESAQQVKLFSLTIYANTYSRSVPFFVSSIKVDGIVLTQGSSKSSLTPGQFIFVQSEMTVYIYSTVDPKTKSVILFNTHFFSNKPLILPYDLASGYDVEWLPYITSIGSIGQKLDDQSTGVVLESSSSIELLNTGFFDNYYDFLIFENKAVNFYCWFAETASTESKKIFEGVIESKDYEADKVSFKVKDFLFRLRDTVKLDKFTSADGTLADSLIGTPKRRIYGQVKQVKCAGIDSLLDGFVGTGTITVNSTVAVVSGTASGTYVSNDLTGTVSGTAGLRTITGIGTTFLTQIFPNQKIRITNGLATYTYKVLSVASNTSLTITSDISVTFATFTAKNYSSGSKSVYGIGTSFLAKVQQGSSLRFTNGVTTLDLKVEYVVSNTELVLTEFLTSTFSGFTITNLDVKKNILTGAGTAFISELSSGDVIKFIVDGVEETATIDVVTSNTNALTTESIDALINGLTFKVDPSVKYYKNNRIWHVAGHKLREPTTTITSVVANNRFIVGSTQDLFADDFVLINSQLVKIRRISENEIVLNSAMAPIPISGDTVKKLPIQNVFFGQKELIYSRDWTYTNTTESKIIFNSNAEFNITDEKMLGVSLGFVSGSSSLTTSSIVDFRSILKPRDFIRKNSINSGENAYYEILDVKEQEIILRTPYSGTTETALAFRKNIDYIVDDSLITCNCLGFEDASGTWLKTPSDAVRHLVMNDAEFATVNETSFTKAKADCDYIVSIVIPEELEGDDVSIRDTITKINESVFGSLYGNSALNISYSILNSDKPELTNIIRDDDILSFTSESSTLIYNEISIRYRPFVDHATSNNTFEVASYNSGFVDKFLNIKNTLEKTLYLYEDDKANIIIQRLALFNSLSNTKVTIKGKMNFFTTSLNDKIFISLDRLFRRFGGNDKRKIGTVVSTSKSQTETSIVISDLGNILNRVPSIAPNTSSDYSSASLDDKIRWGFVVDNDMLTPDASSEENLGNNIIG